MKRFVTKALKDFNTHLLTRINFLGFYYLYNYSRYLIISKKSFLEKNEYIYQF
jgi:hypothetical protein